MAAPKAIQLLDTVALVTDLPDERLRRGNVGTVVEILGPGVFLVEFCDEEGVTYALPTLHDEQLLPLRYQPAA